MTNITKIQSIIRNYQEQLNDKLDNLEEIDKPLGTYSLLRLNHE
jgi:hypothetical protein